VDLSLLTSTSGWFTGESSQLTIFHLKERASFERDVANSINRQPQKEQ
jgi:hypothetical protein